MNTMKNSAYGSQVVELNAAEIEEIAGGPVFIPVVVFVAKAAAAGVIATAAVGFVDGLIDGFTDDQ